MSHHALSIRCIRTPALHLAVLNALCLLVSVTLITAVRAAPANRGAVPGLMAIDDVGAGTLLFKTQKPGRFVPAPVVTTEVDIQVGGMVARVKLRQQFYNPTDSWLEGVYAFPLPENASVDSMRLIIGDQVIEASIKEREAARKAYERARREGRRAALVEQHRPNIFTNSIANIGPRDTVVVELSYQHSLRYDQGKFRLRFPMVVAPRYMPGPLTLASAGENGWTSVTVNGTEKDAIISPVLHPDAGPWNPVTLTIALDAGFPITELTSPYHQVTITDRRDGRARITLADGAVAADRDFELVWTPETGTAPVAGVFRETVDGETYLMVMVLPPHEDRAAAPPPRDAVFVFDHSGSMGGTSITQAKRALELALNRLRPEDRFNIIRFDDRHDSVFAGLRPADAANIRRAKAYVDGTTADGGTVMAPALRQALSGGRDGKRLRQVVFLTDGAVSNEIELLRDIEQRLNGSRLFTVGIGSAPNSYFMRKAAEAGRGSFTYIGKLSEVEERMDGLFRKLERPALTDLLTRWSLAADDKAGVDAYPKLLPDLYHGEPLVIAAKLPGGAALDSNATLQISGILGDRQWRHSLSLGNARKAAGIAALWGRARITDLLDSLRQGADPKTVRKAAIATALRHNLVSRYTSLVAVAKQPVRPKDAVLARRKAPINLPHGWDYDKLFGEHRLKAAPPPKQQARLHTAGTVLGVTGLTLPQGATHATLNILFGLLALLAAGGLLLWRRRSA